MLSLPSSLVLGPTRRLKNAVWFVHAICTKNTACFVCLQLNKCCVGATLGTVEAKKNHKLHQSNTAPIKANICFPAMLQPALCCSLLGSLDPGSGRKCRYNAMVPAYGMVLYTQELSNLAGKGKSPGTRQQHQAAPGTLNPGTSPPYL